jgi:hypothetical protein
MPKSIAEMAAKGKDNYERKVSSMKQNYAAADFSKYGSLGFRATRVSAYNAALTSMKTHYANATLSGDVWAARWLKAMQ